MDFHEVTQRSHTAKKMQIVQGIFDESNVVGLCRECHERYGNTKFGELLFKVLLFERYGIGERQELVW